MRYKTFFIAFDVKYKPLIAHRSRRLIFMNKNQLDPDDQTIWYNNTELKEKVEKIIKKFGKPFLITKSGELLYEDCVVIPAFRDDANTDES